MNKEEFKWLKRRAKYRTEVIEWVYEILNKQKKLDCQKNKTPPKLVNTMISKINVTSVLISVFFNPEFLEALIYRYNVTPENITFFADHPLKEDIVRNLYPGVKTILINKVGMNKKKGKKDGYLLTDQLKEMVSEMGQKNLGTVFANPPYTNNMDLKIIGAVLPLCKEMIVVHPSTWLLDLKKNYALYKKFRKQLNGKLRSVTLFDCNDLFGIQLEVPCTITYIDKKHEGSCLVNHKGKYYNAESMDSITKFGTAWEYTVAPFVTKIKTYINDNDNLFEHRIMNVTEFKNNKFFCQLTAVMNGFTKGQTKLADKFYSLTMKDYTGNIGIRDHATLRVNLVEPSKPSFMFDTEEEVINFLKFCQSDFVRFCLAIYKNNANLIYGEMTLIPWMDFTLKWDDKKLYDLFEINKETQKYIEVFLPDYYGIRGNTEEKK